MSVEVLKAAPPPRAYRFELLPDDAVATAMELLTQPVPDEDSSVELNSAVERGIGRALDYLEREAEERRGALILLSDISEEPSTADGFRAMARRIAEHRPRFRSSEFLRLLVDRASEEAHHAPVRGQRFAELSVVAAENLDQEWLPPAVWQDALAEAWAAVTAGCRLAGDLETAEDAFAQAERHLAAGSGTLMVRANLLVTRASLACDLGHLGPDRLDRGVRSADQAIGILRVAADGPWRARALIARGRLALTRGEVEASMPFFHEALTAVDPAADRPTALAAHHNLAIACARSGRHTEARQHLVTAQAAVRLLARPLGLARLLWLAGRLHQAAGETKLAERSLAEACEAFRRLAENDTENGGAAAEIQAVELDRSRIARSASRWAPLFTGLRVGRTPTPWMDLADRSW